MAKIRIIYLSDNDIIELKRLAINNNPIVLRAKIILEAGNGFGDKDIKQILGVNENTVRRWRNRWLSRDTSDSVLSVLTSLPSTKPKFIDEHYQKLLEIAKQSPETFNYSQEYWTTQSLADEMVKQGIVESISFDQISRMLKVLKYAPYAPRYLKKIRTLKRQTKLNKLKMAKLKS